jgi:predicted site-specific integrase-resolvase
VIEFMTVFTARMHAKRPHKHSDNFEHNLVADVIGIMTVFTARMHGKRSLKNKRVCAL